MKKIIMRAGMSPLDHYDPFTVLAHNKIGNNIGNMLFPYSIARTVMTKDTELETFIPERVKKEKFREYNQTADLCILPFANAFRVSFIDNLKKTTKFVKHMKKPCVVVGVGMQQSLQQNSFSPELDMAVSEFMNAVLEKSALVGVRGEITGAYLKRLGYQEEIHYTVIGCPSMFLYGDTLPEMKVNGLQEASSVCLNSKITLPQKFHDFMHQTSQEYKNYHYIPQVIEEIFRMYAGMPYPEHFVEEIPKYFPMKFSNPIYKKKKGLTFVNAHSWLEFLGEQDFSIGSRIHGNIAAILAGIPSFVIVSDKRILELVEYHQIPHMMLQDLGDHMHAGEIYEKTDFSKVAKGHKQRFDHYLDFLRKNGIETIYDHTGEEVWFDQLVNNIDYPGPVYALSALSVNQQAKRLEQCLGYYRNKKKRK